MTLTEDAGAETLSEGLARFAVGTSADGLPESVLTKTKLMILDGIGLALAAAREDFAARVMRVLPRLGGAGDCTVMGFAETLPVVHSPIINGMLIHAFDFDDSHHPLVIHNESVVLPPALAVAELLGSSGRDFVAACAIGFETSLRVARGTKPNAIHRRGFHPTGVCGVFGAAAAVGSLLGLSEQEQVFAFGLAGAQGSGNMEWQSDGSWSKRFQPGWASHGGVVAAMLAQEGFTAPRTALEGASGFYMTHVGAEFMDVASVNADIGDNWELDRVEFKPYPCGGAFQATIRSCITLRNQYDLTPDDIEHVECRLRVGSEGPVRLLGSHLPDTDYGAHFATPFIAAVALTRGRLTLDDFEGEAFRDPVVASLAAKIDAVDDPNHGRPKYASGHVFVRTKDGRVLEHREHIHPGHFENPVTGDEVMEKFVGNAKRLVSANAAKRLADQILAVDNLSSIRELSEELRIGQ